MDVKEQKSELRKLIGGWNKQFPSELKRKQEESVFQILERVPQFVAAKKIGIYWSTPSEFDTHSFVEKWSASKRIFLPSIEGEELSFCEFEGSDKLVQSSIKTIFESQGSKCAYSDLDLIIVPGVGFTIRGERVGRGGGYYDRLLRNSTVFSIALCYDFQVVTELPLEHHDENVDLVLYYKG